MTTALGNMWRVSERAKKKKRKKERFQVCGQLFHLAPFKMCRGRKGEGEIGGGGLGVCGLCFCYEHLCNGNKLNFKPRALEERHLVPALTLHQLNLFTAGAPFFFFRAALLINESVLKQAAHNKKKQMRPVHKGGGGMQGIGLLLFSCL